MITLAIVSYEGDSLSQFILPCCIIILFEDKMFSYDDVIFYFDMKPSTRHNYVSLVLVEI